MSPSDRTEHVSFLRAAIARIEANAPVPTNRIPQARALPNGGDGRRGVGRAIVPLGPQGGGLDPRGCALDQVLGGGLRRGALHEIVPQDPRHEGAAAGFALALAVRCLEPGGALLWIVEDSARNENGAPYRPGLVGHGLDPDRLVLVRTRSPEATLWATEEALRTKALVVLAELWAGRRYGLAPSRRLLLAARASGATGLLLHAGLPGQAGLSGERTILSSGSETRFAVAAHPSPPVAAGTGTLPVPGSPVFAVQLDKARTATRDLDPHQTFPLLWNAEQRRFHDHDLPVAMASAFADRSSAATGRGRDRRHP